MSVTISNNINQMMVSQNLESPNVECKIGETDSVEELGLFGRI